MNNKFNVGDLIQEISSGNRGKFVGYHNDGRIVMETYMRSYCCAPNDVRLVTDKEKKMLAQISKDLTTRLIGR